MFAFVLSDSAGLLQFEVCPLTDSSFSVSFQHPVNESLVCGEYSLLQQFNYFNCSCTLLAPKEHINKHEKLQNGQYQGQKILAIVMLYFSVLHLRLVVMETQCSTETVIDQW